MIPEHLRYTAEHEWALITESGSVRFGITDHAQSALGDIVFVTLPRVSDEVTAGASCGEVESTKSVSDIYAPISGVVVATNDVVETSPETINADPYGAGWLLEIQPAGAEPLAELMISADYSALIAS